MLALGYVAVKVAAISMNPKKWDKEANALKMERLFHEAAERGAKVAVITEGALEGLAGTHVPSELTDRLVEIAEPIEGPYIGRFRKLAKDLGVCLCMGFAERVDGEVYNSAIFIDYDGEIRGKYHKVTEGGREIRAFETPYGRAGFLICMDRIYPRIARTLVLDGAQVIYLPTNGWRTKFNNLVVLARARENGVPIVQANVGANLIISKGEIVAYKWGNDRVTTATIDIPIHPSEEDTRKMEHEFLEWLTPENAERYIENMETIRKQKRWRALALYSEPF